MFQFQEDPKTVSNVFVKRNLSQRKTKTETMSNILSAKTLSTSVIKKFTPLFQLLFVIQILVRGVGAGVQRNSLICNETSHHSGKMLALRAVSTAASSTEKPFIEYYMEHEVTEKEARHTMALLMRRDKDFDNKKPVPYCEKCTEQIQKYCLGPTFLKDHCCCDFRHETGKSGWI